MIYWMLAREVRILRGELKKDSEWDVLVDLFYYRNVEEEMRKELDDDKDEGDEENPEGEKEEEGEKEAEEGNVW